eukprot:2111778-Pyramimonas_sp.AAC.1
MLRPLWGHAGTTSEPLANHVCATFVQRAPRCAVVDKARKHCVANAGPLWNHFGSLEPLWDHF